MIKIESKWRCGTNHYAVVGLLEAVTGGFFKKAVLKNFAIFTGKHLCWRLFLIQNIGKIFRVPILKNICKRMLVKMFMKLKKKLKIVDKGF